MKAIPLVLLAALLAAPAAAQCQLEKLVAPDAEAGAQFGLAVAIDGETALLGAFAQDGAAPTSGAAYVLVRDGAAWIPSAKLIAPDGISGDSFGFSVDLDGDVAVIGANTHDALAAESGAAYVFERSGGMWSFAAKLVPSDGSVQQRFGEAVAVDGERILVGMHVADEGPPPPGKAWVFERSGGTWSETAILTDPTAADGDHFGCAIDLLGDRIAMGARLDGTAGVLTGAAHVLERAGGSWTITQELHASDPSTGGAFGWSIALDLDRIVVGASDEFSGGPGAAYVFEPIGGVWTETAKLTASDGAPGDRFGFAVALDGDAALVGAPFDDDFGNRSGAAYSYSISGAAFASLVGAPGAVSVGAGGVQALDLHACHEHAGAFYLVLGTLSGTTPGIALGAVTLPLNLDAYLLHSVNHPNSPPLVSSFATLDAAATASAAFDLPAGVVPSLAGATLHHAYLVLKPTGIVFASIAVPVALTP